MKGCLIALSLILVIEGLLAWASGVPGLSAMLAGTVAIGGLTSLWRRRGGEWGWVLLVLLYAGGAVAILGARGIPAVLIATSGLHFVAWYFSARAIRCGAPVLAPGTLDGRPGVFSVAFYGVLLLAAVLVGGGFPLAQKWAVPLAFFLILLGFLLMEKGRFLKLRQGAADRGLGKRGVVVRAVAAAGMMGGLFFLFAKPAPQVADGLVRMALDLQGKSEDDGSSADAMPHLDTVPESEPSAQGAGAGGDAGTAQVTGDTMSQTKKLPMQADLASGHAEVLYLEFDDASQAIALSLRAIYVRSSTLGKYSGVEWGRVGEGREPVWLHDRDDGDVDGRVTLAAEPLGRGGAAEARYKVYQRGADGAGLYSLQGVTAFELEQVQLYDDDWYRAKLLGDVTYRAASRPLTLDDALASGRLEAGDPGGGGVYSDYEKTETTAKIRRLLDGGAQGSLEERLLWLRQYVWDNYEYSTKVENRDQLDPLENFLFVEKRGYCHFYATAGALMARVMGVPSRVAFGYSKGEFDGESVFTFRSDDAHSWTEIYLEGLGWVVFDLTPPNRGGIAPDGEMAAAQRPDLDGFAEAENTAGAGAGEGDGEQQSPDLTDFKGENSALPDLVIYVVFCLALLLLGAWYYSKRDPAGAAGRPDERTELGGRKLPAYFTEFLRLLGVFGLEPQHGETLVEMLRMLRRAGVAVDGFEAMKRYHYGTRYEDQPVDAKLERHFLLEVRAFLKSQVKRGGKG